MALSLFNWIGLGLGSALVLIPTVRWFWKRFDMPSKFALDIIRKRKEDEKEAQMWASIELQIQEEEDKKREYYLKQRERIDTAGKSFDKNQEIDVWSKLGIKVELDTTINQKTDSKVASETFELTMENALPIKSNNQEPDWELIKKMSNLDIPQDGVPEAPDLGSLDN